MRTYLLRQVIYTGLAAGLLIMSEAKADVNIAVIAPQAGESQAFGEELISGVKIAVEGINAQGGLNGEKINLITVDDRCDDRLAVSTAQMMAVNTSQTDKISMVIGPYCSNAFEQVSGIYAKANIFQIVPTALSTKTAGKDYQGLVKMAGYKDRQSVDFYNFYTKRYPEARVAIVYDSNDREIVEIAASLQQEFKKHGKLNKLQAFSYTSYEDADDLAETVAKSGIRLAYILGSPTQSAEMAKLLKSEDERFAIFVSKYKAQEDYDEIMGDLADDTYYVGLPSLKDSPDFAETLVQLRLHGIEPEGLGVYGFSAVKLWEALVKKAGSFDYAKLSSALNNGSVETVWGTTMFNNGTPEKALNYGIFIRRGGQYTQVY